MFARFFGGSAPEAADVASAKDEGGGSNAAEGETPQKDQGVANQISKMDSIIRWVRYLACSFVAWWVSS